MRISRRALCCATAALALGGFGPHARAETWVRSKLARFGVALSHPSSFKPVTPAWGNQGDPSSISDGNTETLSDGTMSVCLQCEPTWDRRVFETVWKDQLRARGSSITYKVKRDGWFVVSGVEPGGVEFYTKAWLLPEGGFLLEATYPHARNSAYDPILDRMLKDFQPGITKAAPALAQTPVRLSEKDAQRIVAQKLNFKPATGRYLLSDSIQQRDGHDYIVVHGYDLVIDDPANGTGHTATWGWYYVDAQTGAAYNWDLAADKLEPIKPLQLR